MEGVADPFGVRPWIQSSDDMDSNSDSDSEQEESDEDIY